jgi:hypothetical protein
MKNIFIVIFSLFLLFLASCSSQTENTTDTVSQVNEIIQPDRKVDLYGKITGMEGNEISILEVDTSKDPTFNMTPTEKKKYMTSLDESTRMALKEEINNATL